MATTASKEVPDGPHGDHHSLRGIFFIMLGSFSFSTMFLLVKVMSQMNTFTLVFYRSVVQIAICLVDLYKKGVNPLGPDSGSVRFYLVLRAGFGAAAVIAWFYGIQNLPLPDAVTLQFTTPPFAAVFAVCLVGEHWKALDMIGAVVCLMGVALIAHPTWLFGNTDAVADAALVTDATDNSTMMKAVAVLVTEVGAAMAGIAYVCVRKIGDRADAVVMVFYYGIISLPMTAIGSKMLLGTWNVLGDYEQFSLMDYFLLLLVGFAGYGGQWFTNLGLQQETAATATLATSTQIVWTFIFEILFLHEEIDIWSISGTALILGFMMVVGVMKLLESDKSAIIVDTDEEKGLLLEPSREDEGYGAAVTLQSQGSNSL
mmetsp:Transcript_5992/g.8520  ORF Transcript_5992/g.8520 Transcript_5992/m.8520 type:complete len:372 (-) Transcript_5992:80-1195(-)